MCIRDSYTLLRETRRTSAPMGDAHLTYTGTAGPVPGILAAEAGQYLLGIPREVFLRSAFIGQNALAVPVRRVRSCGPAPRRRIL